MSQFSEWGTLVVLLFITLGPCAVTSPLTRNSVEGWYKTLRKPSWNPPPWLFGPVWTVLYISMAVAAWLVWKQEHGADSVALRLYAFQLLLNHAWSPVFFGLRRPGAALAVILFLWAAIVATAVSFALVSVTAAKLMLPYLAWVSFATFLNYTIWRLNR